MTSINSHIQIPRFILKQFENEKGLLDFYDFTDKPKCGFANVERIKPGQSKHLNTEKDFFSENTERFLNENVERPFSKFLNKAKGILDGNTVTLDCHDKETVIRYFNALLARGTECQKDVGEDLYSSIFIQETTPAANTSSAAKTFLHDMCAIFGITSVKNKIVGDNPCVSLGINTTNIPFVLPNIGFCLCKNTIIAPVTPKLAVIIALEEKERFLREDGLYCAKFETEETVKNLNCRLFISEAANRRYVTATSKEQLAEIVAEMHRDGLLPENESAV